jgi:hypothetical protein
VFDFYTDKEEVDLADDDVLEVISVSCAISICQCNSDRARTK